MHLGRLLEILEIRIVFGNEQRIGLRQRGDELRIDGEVVLDAMARGAGPPIATEWCAEEQIGADTRIDAHDADRHAGIGGAGRRHIRGRDRRFDRRIGRRIRYGGRWLARLIAAVRDTAGSDKQCEQNGTAM
ncbi:MAG: hypothetical protein E6J91_21850 [Deltaproteobacteria bacterium]|nr:MAG: hypothetical protein E6J91_21850 [Deltaproteobacteria bacterium]